MRKFYLLWIYALTLTAMSLTSVLLFKEDHKMLADATSRIATLANTLEDSVILNYNEGRLGRIAKLVDRLQSNHKLLGLTLCDLTEGKSLGYPKNQSWENLCNQPKSIKSFKIEKDSNWIDSISNKKIQYYSHRVQDTSPNGQKSVYLILAQDISHLRSGWIVTFFRVFISLWLAGAIILLLAATQMSGWLKENFLLVQQAIRSMIAGKRPERIISLLEEPISKEIEKLADKIMALNQSSKSPNKSQILPSTSHWLKSTLQSMGNQKLTVIANREPYIHEHKKGKIEVVRPASGLVTALEPVLRQLGGLWIAHGSGSADRETSNDEGEVLVPPNNPTYTLRRVNLNRDEELGYYYGFSNEGLWPLCHLAHTRPIFRLSDWEHYITVNQRFTQAVPTEALSSQSLILVQDYHFALLPRMLKDRAALTQAQPRIGLFWHIPWPNPEAFGICPWSKNLLRGMLGADVIGFHTQYHCNNFLETCNRYLEARIDWEHFSVTMDNHETHVRSFPIGINTSLVKCLSDLEIQNLKLHYGISAEIVAVGVDRLDYTKGLVERIEAVERLLEKYPEYIGKFSLVQMGSPSRTHIPAYRCLAEDLEVAVNRVNSRFGGLPSQPAYKPVVLLHRHHEWEEIQYFYQLGNLCLVTSLHDGMNLVAKEYVWCQRSDRGALILSKFTGASRELTEAFIINPYSTEEMADAIAEAIRLPQDERIKRMDAMKEKIQAHSAFHWASDLIQALLKKEESSSLQESLHPHGHSYVQKSYRAKSASPFL